MTKVMDCAMRLLCRREHGAYELAVKLKQKGFTSPEIEETLAECQRLSLQSDERYISSMMRTRISQGYGPVRIRQELRSQKIDSDLIEDILASEEENWIRYASALWQKKCKGQTDLEYEVSQKYKKFLMNKGFSLDVINKIL